MTNTIIAQCTPSGAGAIALLRLSGDQAIAIAARMSKLASGKSLSTLPTHTIHYGWVIDHAGTQLDAVMFLLMKAPRTFTGEDTVEITCHNNPLIIQAIIDQALVHGAHLAQRGEFAKRAYLNKKIDLVQAEAINEVIHANNQQALKKSLAQLDGSLSAFVAELEKPLVKALAFSEASFEFIDEDMSFDKQIAHIIENNLARIATLKKTFDAQQQLRQGVRIALLGSVNAGKSSLFNAMLNRERAIVTNIAGTTRDSVEAGLTRNGTAWTLVDTAGLRSTDDLVEKKGIERSFDEARLADIVLLVVDQSRVMLPHEQAVYEQLLTHHQKKVIIVFNKCDAPPKLQVSFEHELSIAVSCATRHHLEKLEVLLEKKVAALFANIESPFLLNARHCTLLTQLEQHLLKIKQMLTGTVDYELVSYELTHALEHLSEFSGRTISEAGMDAVFKEFCVGK